MGQKRERPTPKNRTGSVRRNYGRATTVLAVVAVIGWGAAELWSRVAADVAHQDKYLLTAERVKLSEPPSWIVGDLRTEIVRDAGIVGHLSVLDERFFEKVRDALLLNPLVESVDRIEKLTPAGADVQLTYREPVAAVELPDGPRRRLAPVDARGIRLPEVNIQESRLHWLPRIVGIVGEPPLGRAWDDPRVMGAVEIAVRLRQRWRELHLSEIVPSARPRIRGDSSYYEFDLITIGSTRIVWGAAPGENAPEEDSFDAKLERLMEGVERTGPLNTVHGPKTVNVRNSLEIVPRAARRPPSPLEPETEFR